jgi:hypothetical protein
MCVRPSPHNARRAALADGPVSQEERLNTAEANAAVTERQARQLPNRYAVGYCFACSLAPLVWGLPR